jgi:signal transduction histidine kinase
LEAGLRRPLLARALARRLGWIDVTSELSPERRRRGAMATAGVYLLTIGPTLALVSLALPAGAGEDARAIVPLALGGYAAAGVFFLGFDRLPEWSFQVAAVAGIGLIAAAVHFAGDLQPVYVLFLAGVPLYSAYFFSAPVALGHSAFAGAACGFALELGSGGIEYAALATPVLAAPLSLMVFLRRRERRLADALLASQAELREAQKLEAIGRLAGGIAHELNNALTAISGYAELLEADVADERQRANARAIVAASERVAALTSQLLAVGGRHVLRRVSLDLNECLRDLEPSLRRLCGDGIDLRLETDASLGAVHADRSRCEEMILALAENACEAMPNRGVLEVVTAAALVPEGSRGPDGLPAGRYAALAIRDTGVGIAPEEREHLFEPFFSTKGGGPSAGIGLAAVKGIVSQSGGAIEFESVPGAGSVFRVWLPVADPPAPGA